MASAAGGMLAMRAPVRWTAIPVSRGVPRRPRLAARRRSAICNAASTESSSAWGIWQNTSGSIPVELDLYGLLGATPRTPASAIETLGRQRLTPPPGTEGFSEECLLVREEILNKAVQQLSVTAARQEYDKALLAGNTVAVPLEKLSGALALLQVNTLRLPISLASPPVSELSACVLYCARVLSGRPSSCSRTFEGAHPYFCCPQEAGFAASVFEAGIAALSVRGRFPPAPTPAGRGRTEPSFVTNELVVASPHLLSSVPRRRTRAAASHGARTSPSRSPWRTPMWPARRCRARGLNFPLLSARELAHPPWTPRRRLLTAASPRSASPRLTVAWLPTVRRPSPLRRSPGCARHPPERGACPTAQGPPCRRLRFVSAL